MYCRYQETIPFKGNSFLGNFLNHQPLSTSPKYQPQMKISTIVFAQDTGSFMGALKGFCQNKAIQPSYFNILIFPLGVRGNVSIKVNMSNFKHAPTRTFGLLWVMCF